jgi:hypothetical protein
MGTLIHSEKFNETIPLIENANHVVNEIKKRVPIVAYITARPVTVLEATKRWLVQHGFPEAPILMRPLDLKVSEADLKSRNQWKSKLLAELYPEVKGIIDDNIGLADELHELGYKGTHYLYGRKVEKNLPHVVVCPTWGSVLENLRV